MCCTVCERKFVSIRMEYGGTREVLYWKKREDETWGISRTASLPVGLLGKLLETFFLLWEGREEA